MITLSGVEIVFLMLGVAMTLFIVACAVCKRCPMCN
jgi:hypothetical protein